VSKNAELPNFRAMGCWISAWGWLADRWPGYLEIGRCLRRIWVILWMFAGRAAKRKITPPRLALIDFSPSPESDRRRDSLKKSTQD
jgi:hypothetical protein